MLQAFLLGCVAFIGKCDLATGTNMIQRPIVLGSLVGLILGDLQTGIVVGATLELAFLGLLIRQADPEPFRSGICWCLYPSKCYRWWCARNSLCDCYR